MKRSLQHSSIICITVLCVSLIFRFRESCVNIGAMAEKDSSNKRKREEAVEEDSSNKRIDFCFEIDDEYDWMDPFEMEIEERQPEEAAEKDSSNKRKREEAVEEDSSNKRIDFRIEIDDEYDWMDPFEMEIEERQREEAAEKDSSNMRIDWMEPFDVEKLEIEIKERQREEAAQKDSSDKRIDFRFESDDDEYDWMDPVEVEKLEMEREEIEERQREKADLDLIDWCPVFRFEIDDMEEFIQKKRERRSKENLETSVVQFIKRQEIGLKKPRTNSLRKFLLSHEERVCHLNMKMSPG